MNAGRQMRAAPQAVKTESPRADPVRGRQQHRDGAVRCEANVDAVLRSPGHALDPVARDVMEPRFAHDFSRVRVHTDSGAARSARELNALAYTVGSNIVFDAGQYAPNTAAGQRLLGHELAHVVQQRANAPDAAPRSLGLPGSESEQEADGAARDIAMGRNANVRLSCHPQLARETRSDLYMLSDEQLESERALKHDWLLKMDSSDPRFAQATADLQRTEAEVARRAPARQAAALRQKRTVAGVAALGIPFLPLLGMGSGQSVFYSEFEYGMRDGFAEQPGPRKAAIEARFRDLSDPTSHYAEKLEFSTGFAKGIALGLWGEIEGIWDLLVLLPQLQARMNLWLLEQSKKYRGLGVLEAKGKALLASLNEVTGKAVKELKAFFADPKGSVKTLMTMVDGMLAAGLAKAYQFGLQSVDKAMALAEKPYGELGEGVGKITGVVLFQVVMLLATDAIGNLIAKGVGLLAKIGRAAMTGIAEVANAVRVVAGDAMALIRNLAKGALKAFEGTLDALSALFRRVMSFFDEVAQAVGPQLALAGEGHPSPNLLMSAAGDGGKPVRSTMTTVEELVGPPRSTGAAVDELEQVKRGAGSRDPRELGQLAQAGTQIQRQSVSAWARRLGANWEAMETREAWPAWLRKRFPQGGPDMVAFNAKEGKILVGDIAPNASSLVDVRPGMGRGAPAGSRSAAEQAVVRAGDDGKMLHIEKTIDDARRIAADLPEELKNYQVIAQEFHYETGQFTKQIKVP
jgi:Domain of unknown function (DUF4157)